jgi:hypothetical protein
MAGWTPDGESLRLPLLEQGTNILARPSAEKVDELEIEQSCSSEPKTKLSDWTMSPFSVLGFELQDSFDFEFVQFLRGSVKLLRPWNRTNLR